MASSYMTFTPSGAGTSHRTGTISAWLKRADVSSSQRFWGVRYDASHTCEVTFNEHIQIFANYAGSTQINLRTTAKYQDPGAWYHVVVAIDTEQSVEADRVKLYVNGVQNSTFSTYTTYPAEDANLLIGHGYPTSVGAMGAEGSNMWNGCISWAQYVDGLQLAPTEFGEFDSTSGIWKIKTDVYGTPGINGFCLKMEDRTNLDLDSSSNAHTFTTVGTPTATYDNPSNNFCTMNPLDNYYAGSAFSKGNNTVATSLSAYTSNTGTLGVGAGKWYYEFKNTGASGTNQSRCGWNAIIATSATNQGPGTLTPAVGVQMNDGQAVVNGSSSAYGSATAEGNLVRCAIDIDNNKAWFGNSAGWFDSGDPAAGTNAITITAPDSTTSAMGVYTPSYGDNHDGETGYIGEFNFGNGYFGTTAVSSANADDAGIGAFEYEPPTGFYALCTKNIKAYGG